MSFCKNYFNLKIYIYLHKQSPSSRLIVSPSVATTVYSSHQSPSSRVIVSPSLGTIFFSAISFFKSFCISISGNSSIFFSAVSFFKSYHTVYLRLWELYSSQQSPSSRIIVAPSVATTVYSSQQSPSPRVNIYLHLWELQYILLSNLLLQELIYISISGNYILLINLLPLELLYLHLWELQYILLSYLLLGSHIFAANCVFLRITVSFL
jgi:hypothetical protein